MQDAVVNVKARESALLSIIAQVYLKLHSVGRTAAQIGFAFAPVPAYLPQYLSIRNSIGTTIPPQLAIQNGSSDESKDHEALPEGFSPISVFILLMAHLMRLTYFWGIWVLQGRRKSSNANLTPPLSATVKVDIIGQSLVMLCLQLMLLNAMVAQTRFERKKRMENEGIHKPAMKRFSLKNFWKWDHFRIYLEFLLFAFVYSLSSCYALLLTYDFAGANMFGNASVLLESGLALPQLILNYKKKSTKGLSLIMILGWVIGDSMKFMYFFWSKHATESSGQSNSENDKFVWGSICAIILDFSVFVQVIHFYPNEEVQRLKEKLYKIYTRRPRGVKRSQSDTILN